MLEPATKICFCCKEEKPVSDFSVRKDRGTPLSYCKPCTSKKTSDGKKRRKALNPKPPKTGVSQETRDKISRARSKWLAENPDKHPWRKKGDDKFKSVPCEKMKEFLTSKGLTFAAEYQPEVGGRHFSIDIAFPDKKIAIEVNGTQHYERDGNLKPYYQERHDLLESHGWQVYEVYYSMCYNLEKWEHMIPTILAADKKVEFDYLKYVPRQKKTICCKFCGKETVNYKVYCNKECRESYKITNAAPSKEYEERVSSIISSNKSGARACPNCGGAKSIGANLCSECDAKRKASESKMPSKDELLSVIFTMPMTHVGKKYGVNSNSVKKWCQKYGIELGKRRGYWSKIAVGATHEEALFKPEEKKPRIPRKVVSPETKSAIIADYQGGVRTKDICLKYSLHMTTICDITKEYRQKENVTTEGIEPST